MTSRRRVQAALERQTTDRPPIDLGGTIVTTLRAGVYNRLKEHLGIGSPPLSGSGPSRKIQVEPEVADRLDIDTRYVGTGAPHSSCELATNDGYYRNEWGVGYRTPPGDEFAYVPDEAPLADATVGDLAHYDWPDPLDSGRTEGAREKARALLERTDRAIVGNVDKPSILELALAMRGFEAFLADLAEGSVFARRLLDRIAELQIIRYEQFLEQTGDYLDVIVFADDVGMQHGLLISPATYRRMIKPLHTALYDAIRRKTDARIFFHSCGDCYPLIRDFIDIGVDVLNPIQVSATNMQADRLKREFGKDLSFWGAIDTQHVLPHGSEADVRADVRRRISDLGRGGGFVVAAVHNLQDDVPPENLVAMFSEARRGKT